MYPAVLSCRVKYGMAAFVDHDVFDGIPGINMVIDYRTTLYYSSIFIHLLISGEFPFFQVSFTFRPLTI